MKKILTILTFLLICLFIATTLYVFDIPPFDQKRIDSWLGKKEPPVTTSSTTETKPLEPLTLPPEEKKTFDEHIKKGDSLTQGGFNDLAIKEYTAASKLDHSSPLPLVKIGKIHLKNNQLDKAVLIFETAITKSPSDLAANLNLGRTHIARKNLDKARDIFNQLDPNNQLVKYYQGLMAILDNDQTKARDLLEQTAAMPDSPETAAKAQKFLNAYKEFHTFRGGEDSHLKTLLARALTTVEEYQMAIHLLFQTIREKNNYRDAWILLGYSYLKTGQPSEAVDALEEAKKLDAQKAETAFFLGLAYFSLNDLERAATELENAKENGFEPRVQVEQKLAEIYIIKEEYKKAANHYEDVIALNDDNVDYFVRPVWIYLTQLKDPNKALSLAQKAEKSHPDMAMSHNLVGWAQYEKGNMAEAKKSLSYALKIDNDFDAAWLNLGMVYEYEKQYETAKEYYRKAFELGKGNTISTIADERFKQINSSQSSFTTSSLHIQ